MKNKQNEKILENVKLKISISNFDKEEKIVMKKTSKNILKVGAVACCLVVSITGVVFAKEIGNFVKNLFGANTSDGVDTAVNNGYVADVKTEYQNADGIEIQIDSILMDDFNFDINFNVKVSDEYDIDEFEHIDLEDLKVRDETGKIVFDTHTLMEGKTEEEIEKEEHYMGSYSFLPQKINDNQFKVSLSATGNPEAFPKSKHLTASLTKIRTWKYIEEERTDKVYEGNWNFEIDVPEEFYNRETIIYKAKSCNDDSININEIVASLSSTALKISIPEMQTNKVNYEALRNYDGVSIYNMMALQKEYVETSDGKKFETSQRSDGDGGYGVPEGEQKIIDYHQTFNLSKYDATDEITIHIFTNKGEEIIIELEKSK